MRAKSVIAALRQHRTIPALRLKHRSGGSPRQEPPQAAVALRSASLRLGVRHGICVAKMLDKTSSIICAFGLASAAPRSPYRHLELCGIAFTFFMGASGAPSTDSPEGTECVEELQKKNQITGPRQWISMALKYWMASFLVISPLSTRSSLAKASSPTCSMVLSPVMIRPAFRSISFSMRW